MKESMIILGLKSGEGKMARAYLGLGSNMGDKYENIHRAINMLREHGQIKVLKISSWYETEPVGYQDQDWFVNVVLQIDTSLEPYPLLEYCHWIEERLKRERKIRWGPRTIDVDILLYEDYVSNEEKLVLPHPRMTERAFVMVPLYEIAPDLKIKGEPIGQIVHRLKGEKIRIVSARPR